ncbi:MAG: transcription termination factor NusA [Elusimicrobiota bacterium]
MSEIKSELLPVLEQIERDKGIKREELLSLIESALVSAFRKHSGRMQNVVAKIDPTTAEIKTYIIKKVVEEVKNPNSEISLEEARKYRARIKLDSEIKFAVDISDFSRIAAQTAKQVIVQKIRETERGNLYLEYKAKEGEVVSGTVYRFVDRNLIIDLGKTEAILPQREQVNNEHFNVGDRLKLLIAKVDNTPRGPQIVVSRNNPNLVRKLFEQEVPEIYDKTVEIVNIAREPGVRSKVAVRSFNNRVDPVGACVGVKGSRVRPIINELQGERLDLVPFSEETEKYIANSLNPAKILSLTLNQGKKAALVIVADDQLSLSIGKAGQNVRLAARLTGWHIDIKTEAQRKEHLKQEMEAGLQEIAGLPKIGAKLAQLLVKAGYTRIKMLAEIDPENLTILQGVGPKKAEKIVTLAKEYLKQKQTPEEEKPDAQKENSGRKT